jgi:hypothetical protein
VVTWSGNPKRDSKTDESPPYVFVGNDIGVWVGIPPRDFADPDAEWEWHDISANLPNVIVSDLVYHRESGSLLAATYGRSIWRLTKEDRDAVIEAAKSRPAAEAVPRTQQDTSALNDQLLKLLDCLRHG